MNAIERDLALQAMRLAHAIDADLSKPTKKQPAGQSYQLVLARARHEAALAMNMLVQADPGEPNIIRALQNDVKRYLEMIEWTRQALIDGSEAARDITEQDRQAVHDLATDWRGQNDDDEE